EIGFLSFGDFLSKTFVKECTEKPFERKKETEQARSRQHERKQFSVKHFREAATDLFLDDRPADVGEAPVLHARGTGGLAGTAGQAAIEMELRLRGRRRALEHLLDEVDAPARPVELVAEQLVGRAGRGAEAAVPALAQD